jgi:hypothetical protein
MSNPYPSEETSIWNTPAANKKKPLRGPVENQDDAIIQISIDESFSFEKQNENIKGLYPPLYYIIKDYFKIVDLFDPVTNEEKVYTQEAVNDYMVYFFALEKKSCLNFPVIRTKAQKKAC